MISQTCHWLRIGSISEKQVPEACRKKSAQEIDLRYPHLTRNDHGAICPTGEICPNSVAAASSRRPKISTQPAKNRTPDPLFETPRPHGRPGHVFVRSISSRRAVPKKFEFTKPRRHRSLRPSVSACDIMSFDQTRESEQSASGFHESPSAHAECTAVRPLPS